MLASLKVSNFLSYNSETELSLSAGKIRKNYERIFSSKQQRILKCMAIFGANASGKSNLVKSLDFMKTMIINDETPKGFSNKYFRLKPENVDKPSIFEVNIIINNKCIVYGFEVLLSKNYVQKEWLYEKTLTKGNRMLYIKDNILQTFEIGEYFKNSTSKLRLNLYGQDSIGSNILFLSLINNNKEKMFEENIELAILKDIYNWFDNRLKLHFPNNRMNIHPRFIESNITHISMILKALDTGINDLLIKEESIEKVKDKVDKFIIEDIYENLIKSQNEGEPRIVVLRSINQFYTFELLDDRNMKIKTIQFEHEKKNVYFDLDEESDGTTRLLDLIEVLLDFDGNEIYIFDEIERCLHPSITTKFLKLYLNLAKFRNTQLIMTTHESRILAEELLRLDELSYVNKDNEGSSRIFSCDKMNLRSDKKIYNAFFDNDLVGILPNIDHESLSNEIVALLNN